MKLQIKNADIEIIVNALKDLDGIYEVVTVGLDPAGKPMQERKLTTRYVYKSGRVKFNIAKNLRLLDTASEPVIKTIQAHAEACKPTPEATTLEGADAIKYHKLRNDVLEIPIEIDNIMPIKLSDLELEKNNISALTIACLHGIVIDDLPD